MRLLLIISLRNLFRQKRRSALLGAAIAIGMAILVIANSFSHGISDLLFNRILAFVSGHVSVAFTQNGNAMRPYFRDGERLMETARRAFPEGSRVTEGVGLFSRAIGNGRSDNVILVGMDTRSKATKKQVADLKANFRMVQGRYEDLQRDDIENPVLVASDKAEYLKLRLGDAVKVRFQDIYGRSQAASLTVAGIFHPANVFMSAPVFLDLRVVRRLAGYGQHDIGQIYVTMPDPKAHAVEAADRLHGMLHPPLAAAFGRLEKAARGAGAQSAGVQAAVGRRAGTQPAAGEASVGQRAGAQPATVLGFRVDSSSLSGLSRLLKPYLPAAMDSLRRTDVLIDHALADSLGLHVGDRCLLRYRAKHDTGEGVADLKVTAVLADNPMVSGHAILVNDKDFYAFYYAEWPLAPTREQGAFLPDSGNALYPFLCREWNLLPRTRTTEELRRKYQDIPGMKSHATTVDVQTMYESASMVVKLEYALNLITLAAVLILFFIIQVGVINTLRMTIRERTREIGTIRAIGMQKSSVRSIFMLETFFLAWFACCAGLALAFVGMALLHLIPFHMEGNPLGMLLVDGHLYFKSNPWGIIAYLALILAIAVGTAWFPSRRAADLPAAEALRHYG